jgi:type IV secretion system protein VirB1
MSAVISAESRGYQFAIADAGPVALPWSQRKSMVRSFYLDSLEASVAKATELIRNGHTVSIGLAQVNDRNLARYGVSIREVFDPCLNVSVGGRILTDFYLKALAKFGSQQKALHAALSAYNSGDWVRGAKDGYVNSVYKQVGRPLTMRGGGPLSNGAAASVESLTVPRPVVFSGVKGTSGIPYGASPRAFLMESNEFASRHSASD